MLRLDRAYKADFGRVVCNIIRHVKGRAVRMSRDAVLLTQIPKRSAAYPSTSKPKTINSQQAVVVVVSSSRVPCTKTTAPRILERSPTHPAQRTPRRLLRTRSQPAATAAAEPTRISQKILRASFWSVHLVFQGTPPCRLGSLVLCETQIGRSVITVPYSMSGRPISSDGRACVCACGCSLLLSPISSSRASKRAKRARSKESFSLLQPLPSLPQSQSV